MAGKGRQLYAGVYSRLLFIPAGSEPSGRVYASIWRAPRGLNTPMLASFLV